jgi:transposase
MPRSRPPYPAEFRQQIIELARAGRTPAELSREFGCTAQTIANWLGAAGGAPHITTTKARAEALSATEREELIRLRRQVRQIQMERDILAKATAWFAAKSDKTFTPSSNS